MAAILISHIEKTPGICTGRARIAGSHVRVMDIVAAAIHEGASIDRVAMWYPDVSLSAIHAALAYYYDHVEEIEGELEDDSHAEARFRASSPHLAAEL
jgi:uncharacterized protein (DUF433 family)